MQTVRSNLTCTRCVQRALLQQRAGTRPPGRRHRRPPLLHCTPCSHHARSEDCEPQVGTYFVNGTLTDRQMQPLTMRTSSVCCVTCRQWGPCVAW